MAELTVLMPVYNGLPYVTEACQSILTQTFSDFEFHILDDASTDGSLDYVESLTTDPRVRVHRCRKQGVAALLNHGLAQVRTPHVAIMHADDISEPTRLEEQIGFMKTNPDVVLCGCQVRWIDNTGRVKDTVHYETSDLALRFQLMFSCPFTHPGVIYRTADALAVGGYEPELVPAEDYDLWCKLSSRGRLANLRSRLLRYRIHQTNLSVVRRDQMRAHAAGISGRLMQSLGYARTEEEAARFRRTALERLPAVQQEEIALYRKVVDRYLSAAKGNGGVREGREELQKFLRWDMLSRAEQCVPFSRSFFRWVSLARRFDPVGMRADNLMRRALSRAGMSLRSLVTRTKG